jgi:SAM-dependent methyltransferase
MTDMAENGDELLDATLSRLRRRVEERMAAGEYPPALLDELDAQYRRLAASREGGAGSLDSGLAAVDRSADIGRHRIYTDSRRMLGSAVHRAVGRATVRQTTGVLDQVAEFAVAVRDLLHAIVDTLPEEDIADLSGRVDYLLDRIAAYERAPAGGDAAMRELSARLDAVEAALHRGDGAAHIPSTVLDAARTAQSDGAAEEVRRTVAALDWRGPVLVLNAGRGETFRLLRECGADATGVEADPELAGAAASAGLPVVEADPVAHLEAVADSSLGGIVAVRGVEEASPRRLVALVEAAARALRPGGHLLIAASPRSVLTAGPRWAAGIPAEFIRLTVEQSAFASVDVRRRSAAAAQDASFDGLDPAVRHLLERVAAIELELAPYLVVATR